MSANEDFLDSLLKSVTDDSADGTGDGNSLDMDSLLADIDSLDLETLDLGALDLDTLGELPDIGSPLPSTESSDSANLEEALTMTQEEIEQLLRETQEASELQDENRFDVNGDDLTQLLSGLDGEAGESGEEISSLLQKADNNEVIDEQMAEMMQQEESFDDASDLFLASLGEEEVPEKKGLFGRKKKEKKPKEKKVKEKKKTKKSKKQEENVAAEEEQEAFVENLEIVELETPVEEKKSKEKAPKEKKKGGLGSKFAALFADAQEDEADEILATLQQQNDAILMEMQEEDKKAVKGKKSSKKDKKKKDKKEEKPKKDKKPKKEKKAKKEKITQIDSAEKEPKQYFPMKKAMTIVFVCVMLLAAFLVLNGVLTTHSIGIQAAQAYEEEQYMECYQLLAGQDMTEEQEKMFYRSELILQMRLFKQHCNEYLNAGQELEAVDKLVQFVYDYEQLLDYATRHECVDIVEPTYAEVLAALQTYGVSAEDALSIAREITDKDYTKALIRVIEGTNQKEEDVVIEPIFKDMLPEEASRQP